MKHKKKNLLFFRLAAVLFVVGLIVGIAGFAHASDISPTIATDKTKYSLGEVMVISGAGFTPEGAVIITVQQPGNNGIDSLSVTADASGSFVRSYSPPMIPGRYKFDATDGSNAALTAATYADAAKLGADFYGWNIADRTLGYPDWTGDWTKGDLGKNYREGDWVSYVFTLTNTGNTAATTADAVTVPPFLADTWGNIYYDFFTDSKNAMFVDLLRNFRWEVISTSDPAIANSGKPDNSVISPALADTFFTNTWWPNTLNKPYNVSGHVQTTETQAAPAEKHFFSLDAGTGELPTTIAPDTRLVIYFEAHLSITFVWENGLEGEYATHSPANTQGGAEYAGWTTNLWKGSGSTAGSSPHFNYDATGFGAITVPIPVPPAPTGQICGLKYNDLNRNGAQDGEEPPLAGWTITISATIDGIPFSSNTTTAEDGTYCFLDLIQGDYTICEILQPDWTQTQPDAEHTPPYCYDISLAENEVMDQTGVDFGNAGASGCLEITKEVDFSGIVGDPSDVPDVDFTVTVTGPSYPDGLDLTFHLVDGVVTYDDEEDATACICDLIPGDYYVTETAPDGWEDADITGDDPAVVESGDTCDDGAPYVSVTNMPTPGCLEVEKIIDLGDIVGDLADIPDAQFDVVITGPSYPFGEELTVSFMLDDGVLYVYDGEDWVEGDSYCICDLIPGNYTITEDAPAGWEEADIEGSPATVDAGDTCDDGAPYVSVTNMPTPGCLEVTKVVELDDYMFASSANSTFTVTVTGPSYPTIGTDLVFDLVNGVLYVYDGQDWVEGDSYCLCDLIPGSYTAAETAPYGWDDADITGSPATVEPGDECDDGAAVITVTNTLLIPNTSISLTADFYETTPGGNVWLYISDTNDGEVPLTDPHVHLYIGGVEFDADPITPGTQPLMKGDDYWSVGAPTWAISPGTPNGDTNDNGIMDVDETWSWAVQVTIYTSSNITVNGHGTDPLGNPVDGPTYSSEEETITIEVGAATRTWGFWKTHLWLVQWMLSPTGGNVTLPIDFGTWGAAGHKEVTDDCTYMALMWANQAKNSDGTMRLSIDQARIHTAQQALAAIMNDSMAGGANLLAWLQANGYPTATDARTLIADILTSGTTKEIRDLGSALAGYNESGDDQALDPGLPATGRTTGNIADPQGARLVGAPCETYWNTPAAPKGKNK